MSAGTHGNLVIGQSGGATAVINASLVGAFEAASTEKCIGGMYGMHYGVEGLLKEDLIDLRQQPLDLWPRLVHTPSAALGSTHYHLKDEDVERLIDILRRKDIRYLLYIGGNGYAETVHRLVCVAHEKHYEFSAVSIPKTIDNDLPCTDHCPGYGSAARFLALTLMHSTMNMLSVPERYPLKVEEAAGRNVGWLTAASALAKRDEDDAPHLILIPEQPFQEQRFLQQVESMYRRLGYAVIVAAEALRDEQGRQFGPTEQDKTKSTAQFLGNLIKESLHMNVRFDKPDDLQWSDISSIDRDEAYLVGQKGVEAVLASKSDAMVTLERQDNAMYRCSTSLVELEKVVNKQRYLPDTYLDAGKCMITQPFYDYALPLLGDPLPAYPKLKPIKVP